MFGRIQALGARLRAAVEPLSGLEVYGDWTDVERAGILSFNVRGRGSAEVCAELWARERVVVSPGIHGSPLALRKIGAAGTIRASVHCYTGEEDLARLVRGLRAVVAGASARA